MSKEKVIFILVANNNDGKDPYVMYASEDPEHLKKVAHEKQCLCEFDEWETDGDGSATAIRYDDDGDEIFIAHIIPIEVV